MKTLKLLKKKEREIKFLQRRGRVYWLLSANFEAEAVKISGKLHWREAAQNTDTFRLWLKKDKRGYLLIKTNWIFLCVFVIFY